MALRKIKIKNFKCFPQFELEFNSGINIVVGNNEEGKSTLLEAVHLALTGYYCGRPIQSEISQYLFNKDVVREYIDTTRSKKFVQPPSIEIEVFFDDSTAPDFEGDKHSDSNICKKSEGFRFLIAYSEKYNEEYQHFLSQADYQVSSLPIEYYNAQWVSFSRDDTITPRSIPVKSAMIDSSGYRYQNGSDVYVSRIVRDILNADEVTSIAQAHRRMRDSFNCDKSIISINKRIEEENEASLKEVPNISLSVDLGTKNTWERTLMTTIGEIPYTFVGKGSQCIVKTELALTHKKAQKAQIILIEEPESHLSFSLLNYLISRIQEKCSGRQIIISTHSSFVANKLGLDSLILLQNGSCVKLTELKTEESKKSGKSDDVKDFFMKLSGYDTLRMVLCQKAILVEGDSDELIVQAAYMQKHNGRLPIHDQIDVISVGTSFLRFLGLAAHLKTRVAVVTDTDGDIEGIKRKYKSYLGENKKPNIKICYDEEIDTGELKIGEKDYNYNTLEPKFFKANGDNLGQFNKLFGTKYQTADEMRKYMQHNKTQCALDVFSANGKFEDGTNIVFPDYILEAISDEW